MVESAVKSLGYGWFTLFVAAVALAALPSAAGTPVAQQEAGEIEEVVVTATKRSARIQDVPFSVTAKTAEEITRAGAGGIEDLARGFVGLGFAVRKDDRDAALHVDNLTDENARLSFDRESGGRARLGFRVNRPRTVGISIRKSF